MQPIQFINKVRDQVKQVKSNNPLLVPIRSLRSCMLESSGMHYNYLRAVKKSALINNQRRETS